MNNIIAQKYRPVYQLVTACFTLSSCDVRFHARSMGEAKQHRPIVVN